ncbi:MAG: 2'-5' RNA ligase family protein [Kurthia sp.]|nr:2'-5' RNA ligase family protein [Candidatus Kurthia equi]
MKYGIVAFPSKEIQDFANSYRMRYDSHYSQLPPHITLRAEVETDEAGLKAVADKLHAVTQKAQSFHVSIEKVGTFKPINNVIYLKVNADEALYDLNKALHVDDFGGPAEYQYVPHITLAQGITADELDDIYGQLRMTEINFEESIDRIHLLYQLENGSWTVFETYRLKGEN